MTRPAAVAGLFYPDDPVELGTLVDGFLAAAAAAAPARAYVVPHAGLRYSGRTAAYVYASLGPVERVVLIGPSHRVPLAGAAVPVSREWSTPLGPSLVDSEGAWALVDAGHAYADDRPHSVEHAIEVQLPFLRRVRPDAPILPVAIGVSTVDDVAALVAAVATPGTIVLCSTDLSHYLDEDEAREQDDRTSRAILDLAADRVGPRDACGLYALRGLLAWAARQDLVVEQLYRSTSADTTGDRARVVGYGAFALR